jgi:hypothetical protein
VILPSDVREPLLYLTNMEVRPQCIHKDNPYVFANSSKKKKVLFYLLHSRIVKQC